MNHSVMSLKQLPINDLHLEYGAKMAPFAGYMMPIQYSMGVLKEHLHTRAHAGLFDVSHMGQLRLVGPNAALALESLIPVDIIDLPLYQQRYAFFTNEVGGILDDLMVTNMGDHLFVVVNAACKEADIAYLKERIGQQVAVEVLNDRALLALQGPAAVNILARLAPSLNYLSWRFMTARNVPIADVPCLITRSGYTGEDGFEISVAATDAERVARLILAQPEVMFVGLGARDSLRLEAGLCLYGHDIDTTTTPVEAGLTWAVSKSRRPDGARAGGFPGVAAIYAGLAVGISKKRVGLISNQKVPVREGAPLVDDQGRSIGRVTSGGVGPSVACPIAMGYVSMEYASLGTNVFAQVRGKNIPMQITTLPFLPPRYYRG